MSRDGKAASANPATGIDALPAWPRNILRDHGINSLAELMAWTEQDLLALRNFGQPQRPKPDASYNYRDNGPTSGSSGPRPVLWST